jgi:hypothetical protein
MKAFTEAENDPSIVGIIEASKQIKKILYIRDLFYAYHTAIKYFVDFRHDTKRSEILKSYNPLIMSFINKLKPMLADLALMPKDLRTALILDKIYNEYRLEY